ncbi:hypothetical protein BDV95DRAFT_664372 [Massariosphaeria phaeospora]|uniref:Eisosome protein 1 n=1 Tax=Massariosphaeria phaeospora TaxID=100035 RepID=A0A7C8IJV8_9PLEO|nr:hypothetical protein BDV95DRAFT_664372 [Massariosphaeria phaeospora]
MATLLIPTSAEADGSSPQGSSDAATMNHPNAKGMPCPDPSAHRTKDNSLQNHASAAALHSIKSKGANVRDPLGADGKLSSASAATSLKHAHAQDLPSYPIVGIDTQSSAGTAATLAHANQKSPEWWKPEHSAAAGKAALLANDYKMAPLWHPEASAAGSKAALLAHNDHTKPDVWTPQASAAGNSAAVLAFKNQGSGAQIDRGYTEDGRRRALVAATGAVSTSGRKRAQSSPAPPPTFPDSANSARNALSAATIASSASTRVPKTRTSAVVTDSNRLGSGAMEAARIQHSKSMSREMYTEHPPVALEVEEKRHKDALRASAIVMAKKMYDVQQQHIDQATGRTAQSHAQAGATVAQAQKPHTTDAEIKEQAMRYIGIQETAQKLAAERLAKIGPDENAKYRSYYGYDKPTRSKLSIRRNRNRASSNPETADSSDDDDLRSRRIRSQMTEFNKSVAEVDAKKRDNDRKHLLAAAERKVQAQMLGMDKKIFDETGKMSPAMVEEWDAKARARAAANSEVRMEHHGKVHIGNGKYMDQTEIDAVALARVQPTLDEITEKTEKRRADEEDRRLDIEMRKRQAHTEKERAHEIKAEEKRAKVLDDEKKAARARTTEEKIVVKQEKEAEKEKKIEEERIAPEAPKVAVPIDVIIPTTRGRTASDDENDDLYRDPTPHGHTQQPAEAEPLDPTSPTSPTSPRSPKSDSKGLKNFFNKFKRRSKHSATSAETDKPGFIGGVALRDSSSHSHPDSLPASPRPAPEQPSDLGRPYSDISSISSGRPSVDGRGRAPERTTSGLSAVSGATDYDEAKDGFNDELPPPPRLATAEASAARKGSPNRDSRFHEIGI